MRNQLMISGFHEYDSKSNAYSQVFEVMVPLVLQVTFIHAHGIQLTYLQVGFYFNINFR